MPARETGSFQSSWVAHASGSLRCAQLSQVEMNKASHWPNRSVRLARQKIAADAEVVRRQTEKELGWYMFVWAGLISKVVELILK